MSDNIPDYIKIFLNNNNDELEKILHENYSKKKGLLNIHLDEENNNVDVFYVDVDMIRQKKLSNNQESVPEPEDPVPETEASVDESEDPVPETEDPVAETEESVAETEESVDESEDPVAETEESYNQKQLNEILKLVETDKIMQIYDKKNNFSFMIKF
mgnify:CR=1 FL=1